MVKLFRLGDFDGELSRTADQPLAENCWIDF